MLRTLRARSPFDWLLAGMAALEMTAVTIAVRVLPYKVWRRVAAAGGAGRNGRALTDVSARQIVRAIDSASRVVPGGTNCLVRALTARMFMGQFGLPSKLTLGVARTPKGKLEGHAWLEYQGTVVIGEAGRERFVPMPDLDERL